MKISLFIPTFNAVSSCGVRFEQNLAKIKETNLYRVLVIDSSSTDNTVEMVSKYGFECKVIPKKEFDHGGTRFIAMEILADSDVIIYLTQDVVLKDHDSINNLIKPMQLDERIATCYGRQIPHQDATVFAKHLRRFNYRKQSYVRGIDDRYVWGMRCIFSSDSFSAYRTKLLRKIGGFPHHLIMGEDVFVTAKLLKAGYKVAYVAEAICYHSHNYSLKEEMQRYFDIGVFHRSESWICDDFGTANKEGVKYVFSICKYVILRRPWLLPLALGKILAKFIGYKLGKNYDGLGVRICRRLSKNKDFWW